jgi:glucokinase
MADPADPAVIGVDVGGTKIAAARVAGQETLGLSQNPTNLASPTDLLDGLEATVREVIEQTGQPEAIGIGLPSQVDFASGTVVSSVNIPLEGVAVAGDLEDRLGARVFVDNDANCAALAEALHTAGDPAQHLVMLTLGTGVGGGVVIDGRIFRGATGLGAELGHVVIQMDGPECPGACPNRGCLEAYCSGTALERDATAFAAEHPDSRLGQVASSGENRVSGRDVVEAARDGDDDARGLLTTLGERLGVGIATFVNIFEPEYVVIGGGLSQAADLFLEAAEAEAAARALPALFERVRISVAQAGNEAGVVGAGLLAAQELSVTRDTSGPRPREEVG